MTSTGMTDSSNLPNSGWGMKCVFAVAALSILCFCLGKVSNGYDALRLRKDGVATQAICTFRSSDDSSYEFSINDVQYRGRVNATLRQGDPVDVVYLPLQPSVNRPQDGLISDMAIGGVIVAFCLVPIFFKLAGIKLVRRDDVAVRHTNAA